MLLAKLNEKGTDIKSLGKTILLVKETLSDVQVLLATKRLSEGLREEQEPVSTIGNKDEAKETVLELSTDHHLKGVVFDLKSFGTIQVVRSPCQINVGDWEQRTAQLNIPISAIRDIDKIKLEVIREISIPVDSNIKDCVLVNDGRMIFANDRNSTIIVYTNEGQLSKSISVGRFPLDWL